MPDPKTRLARPAPPSDGEAKTQPARPGGTEPKPEPAPELLWDRFEVLEPLGAGGMGEVFRCRDTKLGREVAVKLLPDALAADRSARDRLKNEVVGAVDLAHPNIVRVYDYHDPPGGGAGPVGFSMEQLPGATLADHLAGRVPDSPFAGPTTPDRLPWVAALADQLCAAVDHVHDAGLVHRDIKPSNIMLLGDAHGSPAELQVKLLDFGIVHTGLNSGLTGDLPPGTLEYMAPEMLSGRGVPAPSVDIYSLGKVLYFALTGVFPEYGAESATPSSLVEGLPPGANAPLLASLALRPDRRPGKAADLSAVLRSVDAEVRTAQQAAEEEARRKAAEEEARRRAAEEEARRRAAEEESRRQAAEGEPRRKAVEAQKAAMEQSSDSPRSTAGPLAGGLAVGVLVFGIVLVVVVVPRLVGSGSSDPQNISTVDPGDGSTTRDRPPPEPTTPEPPTPAPAVSRPNPASIDWKPIPGGTFSMGSNDGEDDEKPVHDVTVPAFEMSRTEVTVAQYLRCVDEGSCTEPDTGDLCNWGESGKDDHPVNCVDYGQAQTFAWYAGGRLPSEAEWEYAARGGEPHRYSGSSDHDEVACWDRQGSNAGTCEVGSKKANGYELVDMSGNVWEWVQDCYEGSYEGAPDDGSARTSCSGSLRVERGGSWWSPGPSSLRIAFRYKKESSRLYSVLGFRLAGDVP